MRVAEGDDLKWGICSQIKDFSNHLLFYEPSRSKTLFFDLNPKGAKNLCILDFQTPPAPDELSNPDPGPSQRTQG